MTTDRTDLKRELRALLVGAGTRYSHLAREAQKAKIVGLSKSTIRRIFAEGALPRDRESFEALLRLLGVDEEQVEGYWRGVWNRYSFSSEEGAEDTPERTEVEDFYEIYNAPDPIMSPEDREWERRLAEEEEEEAAEDRVPTRVEAQVVGIEYESDWPYGADDDYDMQERIIAWARAHHLRLEKGRVCLDWLTTGSCPHGLHHKRSWMDHITGWNRDDKPAVLLSQPYGVRGMAIKELAEIHANGCPVVIDGTGWYGYGTTFVSIWRDSPRRQ